MQDGTHVQVAACARDVGVDFAGGGRRRVTLQTGRLIKTKTGGKVLAKMVKDCSSFKKLVFTGIMSRLYGFPVLGAAPTTVSHARSAVCHPLGLRKAGGCLTTGLALAGWSHKDPALTMPIENIFEFATGHAASSHCMSTSRVWKVKAPQLGLQGRWSKVHGPMSSAAATLLDFGWQIPEADCWISPDGCQWDLEYQEQNFEGML